MSNWITSGSPARRTNASAVDPSPIDQLPGLVRELYATIDKLKSLFPTQHFTLDGLTVGSIGEVLAEHDYDLTLYRASMKVHDGQTADGTGVQIKATQKEGDVNLKDEPQHLLVLLLKRDGTTDEIYNGPGRLAWDAARPRNKYNVRPIRVSKLRELMRGVDRSDRIRKRN